MPDCVPYNPRMVIVFAEKISREALENGWEICMKRTKIVIGKLLFVIGRHLPVAHHRMKAIGKLSKSYRQLCGNLILNKCGKNVNIYPKSYFSPACELGDNSDIGLYARIQGKCVIGNNVIMGPECNVWTVNHRTDRIDIAIKYQGVTEEKPVVIGDDCWIGSRVTILPGVTIGKGAVIGSGAVVVKSIPDYAVAVGNPARVVKYRDGTPL